MKKIILAVMAVAAIGFTSCGNKTQQGEATDSTAVAVNTADEEPTSKPMMPASSRRLWKL